MSYNTVVVMANDGDLQQRFIACAAQEDLPLPDSWVYTNRWTLVSMDPDAVASYAYAMDTDNDGIGSYGKRSDVINDGKILSIVQALKAQLAPPPVEE